jgi:hypothetical protein
MTDRRGVSMAEAVLLCDGDAVGRRLRFVGGLLR